ncbi:uncharacterized protein LOC122396977 [Colletes gigas]|uniref:uncharacterized protein LOC122396977 n=1 Tax=Colletes gigas TaxID=935657 RepID=UPI001C9B5FB7|nr:uncharacterized protein LOC122396977 [Colletes gigas]
MGAITCYTGMSRVPNVSSILIYAQCADILCNKQLRMELNPISIKLEQMSKFPDNVVIGNGFNYLYAKILFVDRAIVTPYYVPARTIYFEFVKCFLSDEFPAENLISFLGTQFLTVEIIGIRTINVAKSDFNAATNVKSPRALIISDKEEVLLGVATFDVSELIRGSWEVRLTSGLSHPRDMYCIGIDDDSDKGLEKVSRTNSPLTSEILTSFGTCIKIKVRAAYDLRPVHRNVLRHVITLNRIFLILNDFKLANDILADVFSHNLNLLCTLQISNEDNDLQIEDTYKNILTGFAIDCRDKFFIFLEGLSRGYLLQIWENVAKLPTEDGYVYYNSSSVFLARLYEDFVPLGGVLKIKLSESLEAQLQKHGLYVGKTGTMLRSKATRTIGMTTLALTMKSLCQECLFPRPNYIKAFMDEIRENYFGSSGSV